MGIGYQEIVMMLRVTIPLLLAVGWSSAILFADKPVSPKAAAALFNGRDLSGFTTWLKDTKREDPRHVFQVTDGLLHLSGDGDGYVATKKSYRDYHLSVEYKW